MKRVDGRTDGLGGGDGRATARPSAARQGRRTAANLAGVGVNVDLAPVLDVARPGGDDRRHRTRLRLHRAAGRRDRGARSPRPAGRAASRRPPSTSPASARRPKTPTSRCSGSTSRSGSCATSTRLPTGAFVAAGGELVMLSTGDLPGLLPARRLRPADRHRRAARPARLRRGHDHRRARLGRGARLRRPSAVAAWRRRGGRRPPPLHRSAEPPGLASACRPAAQRRRSPGQSSRPRPAASSTCAAPR